MTLRTETVDSVKGVSWLATQTLNIWATHAGFVPEEL